MKQEIKMGDDYSVNETENEDGSLLICPIQKDRSQKKKYWWNDCAGQIRR